MYFEGGAEMRKAGLKRTSQDIDELYGETFDKMDVRRPFLMKDIRRIPERTYDFTKDNYSHRSLQQGKVDNSSRVRIVSTRFNFDVEKLRERDEKAKKEAQAVENNYLREKTILREAYIKRQRQLVSFGKTSSEALNSN